MKFDYSEIVQALLFTFILTRYIDSYFKFSFTSSQLKKLNLKIWGLGITILLLGIVLRSEIIINLYFAYLFIGLIFFLKQSDEKKLVNRLIGAILPYILINININFISFLIPNFYSNHLKFLEPTKGFFTMWLIGFGFYIYRQSKIEQRQKIKDEEEKKILEEQKNSLENQVAERTSELTLQKEALEKSVNELKTTQNQLVHAEKMASLGELTAGIAHEIQNPLNFVNNFAEVSAELIEELKNERIKPKNTRDEKLENEILNDIFLNLEKINHHGKRASSIVTGMLQHSRTSSGLKELTNINELADEYLRLSYHGLRAKDKSFNAYFKSNFDENLPKIEVIPQDIGRVFLNLINNAFYAVNKRKDKKGLIEISTARILNTIEIRVKDNGPGMSYAVKEKIFKPFFTTKPTSEGTGLGLSLAYEIITNGHGGTLDCISTENKGTEFIVKLPITKKSMTK